MRIHVFNETKSKIPSSVIKRIEEVFESSRSFNHLITQSIVNLITHSPKSITKLNKELFKRNTATDVISVNQLTADSLQPSALSKGNKSLLGDIYICPNVIKQNAKKYKVDYNKELTRVIIHGILHLLGYDHKKAFGESKEEMFKVQEKLVKRLRL